MKILFLNSLGKSKWGGGEKWMIHAAKGLENKGHQAIIACQHHSVIEEKSQEIGLTTWDFNIPIDLAYWKMSHLSLFIKQNNVDAVICCQNKDVKIGARAARKSQVKAIFARQGIQNLSNKKKYIKPFTRYIDGIITNTHSIKAAYERFGWFPRDFIHVIYNGVEIPDNVNAIDIHKQFNMQKAEKVIFSAGRLNHQKGFDLLIEVARLAKNQNLKWRIIIAGEGKIKNKLVALAQQKGVNDAVHFIGFSNNIASLLKASDVFVLPSRYEGMPNALLEAMAMGKANGAPELVEDGKTGFLVDSDNPEHIFQKLKVILSNEALRLSMEKEALSRVKENFTINKMTDNLEQLLNEQMRKSSSH